MGRVSGLGVSCLWDEIEASNPILTGERRFCSSVLGCGSAPCERRLSQGSHGREPGLLNGSSDRCDPCDPWLVPIGI
jgi:hypothetical protein